MSKLTEQLREALKKTTDGKWDGISTLSVMINGEPYGQDGNEEFCILAHNLLPALLTEHERWEREATAGKLAIDALEALRLWGDEGENMQRIITTYRTACEK